MRHKQEADLRVRRTRTAIRSTFRQMLLDMDYEQFLLSLHPIIHPGLNSGDKKFGG